MNVVDIGFCTIAWAVIRFHLTITLDYLCCIFPHGKEISCYLPYHDFFFGLNGGEQGAYRIIA